MFKRWTTSFDASAAFDEGRMAIGTGDAARGCERGNLVAGASGYAGGSNYGTPIRVAHQQ